MEKVIKNLEKLDIKYGDAIVIGISGGPDSMALIDHVMKIRKTKDIQIICAHVNHNMRFESEAEKDYVEEYCLINNIVFEYFKIEDYGDDNFHNEARSIRYKYFAKLIEKYNAKFLLTAHHGDDLIETILMRLVRGSTLKGYSGFSEVIDMGTYKIARPLINVTKAEIINYNKENKIAYVTDASNEKDVYTRNRFRKYVVSFLKKEDPNVHDKFYKFSKTVLEYNDFIDRYVKKRLCVVYPQNILNIEEFLKEEKVIQTKIVYYILEHMYQDDLMLINDQHVNLIFSMIESSKPNMEIHLPNNISVIKSYNNITLVEGKEKNHDYEIEVIDFINLPNGKNIERIEKTDKNTNFFCRLSSSDVKLPLHVRNKKEGDKMQIKGMLGSRKISDIFIDEKICSADRQTWPVVVDSDNTIVWLPGLKKSKFDKQKDEKCDIILRYY